MPGAAGGRGRALGDAPPLVDGIHLSGEELQTASQVPLFSEQMLLLAQHLPVLVLEGADKVLGLVEQAERGVARAVGAHGHDVLQALEAIAEMRPAVLLQLVVGRTKNKFE